MTLNDPDPAPLVLVVDDDATQRVIVSEHLPGAGFRVVEAAGGEAGLAQARLLRPDLVMLDVMMPGMDGFAVCRATMVPLRTCC
ncbi:MAG: response regulator [Alphaproteobacteria bacterium]|nr:response regulator [Alphaproteobacteria bacterium]